MTKMRIGILPVAIAAMLYGVAPAQAATVVKGTPVVFQAGASNFPIAQQVTNQTGGATCGEPNDTGACDNSGLWSVGGSQNPGEPLAFAQVGWYQMNISLAKLRYVRSNLSANLIVEKVYTTYSGGPSLYTSANMAIKLAMRTGLPGCNKTPPAKYAPSYDVTSQTFVYVIKWRSTCFQQATNGVNASFVLAAQDYYAGDSFAWNGQTTEVKLTPEHIS